jgi:hypothetical protein
MKIKFTNGFFDSIQRIINRQLWYWQAWDFFRYDLIQGIKNIFFFWKVIWSYRSWDSSYQMRILSRSLEPLAHTLEHYGNEVEETRLKKVAAIKRAIEILNRQSNDDYLELAEKELGYKVNLNYGITGDGEPKAVTEKNRKIFNLSHKLEDKEWNELWKIFKGQNYTHFTMFKDKSTNQNSKELWDKWFDGTGIKSWWD